MGAHRSTECVRQKRCALCHPATIRPRVPCLASCSKLAPALAPRLVCIAEFHLPIARKREPTSGLEPLTCLLRVSRSTAERGPQAFLYALARYICWVPSSVSRARNPGSERVWFRNVDNAQRLGVRTSSYVSSLASASLASRTRVNNEPTSGLEPLTCSLRVCGQWLPVRCTRLQISHR
jgi:hypothetical protein